MEVFRDMQTRLLTRELETLAQSAGGTVLMELMLEGQERASEADDTRRRVLIERVTEYVSKPVLTAEEGGRSYASPWYKVLSDEDNTHFGRLRAHWRAPFTTSDPKQLQRVSVDLQLRSLLPEVEPEQLKDAFVVEVMLGIIKTKSGPALQPSGDPESSWMQMSRAIKNIGDQIDCTSPAIRTDTM